MHVLTRQALASGAIKIDHSPVPAAAPVRVLQIGDGNFLRAFADWMIDIANGAGVCNLAVSMMAARGPGCVPKMRAQDCLYTVVSRGLKDGKLVDARRVVSCIDEALDPHEDWGRALDIARDPSLRFVISNTTEAGITHLAEALPGKECPQSFPARLAALMWARFQSFGGSSASGLVILPCELIEGNGAALKRIVLKHAEAWKLPAAFTDWVSTHNTFCNTLVDRIVPGFPAAEAEGIFADCGYDDPLLVAAEPFHLWVIEAPAAELSRLSAEFPLQRAGLDLRWTEDLAPYRASKVRVLNGAHTASALAAYGAGLDTVREMTQDGVLSAYLQHLMFAEIVPFVPLPEDERVAYAHTILERFANPHIRHELISISLNSVSKWQVRVLPTIRDHLRAHERVPPALAFSLAALIAFYHGKHDEAGAYSGERNGKPYAIRDNAEVLGVFEDVWRNWQEGDDVQPVVHRVLADARLWGSDLTQLGELGAQVSARLAAIKARGMRAALSELVAGIKA